MTLPDSRGWMQEITINVVSVASGDEVYAMWKAMTSLEALRTVRIGRFHDYDSHTLTLLFQAVSQLTNPHLKMLLQQSEWQFNGNHVRTCLRGRGALSQANPFSTSKMGDFCTC